MPRAKPTQPPRRRPRQRRSEETVRVILEAAARVLRKEGYARASTNRIAEVAGVSVGTLYQYFHDKDALFDALVASVFEDVIRDLEARPLDFSQPFETTLHTLIEVGVRALRHGPELLRALEQVPGAVFRRRLAAGKTRMTVFLRHVLEAYRDVLRPLDLDRAAVILLNVAEGVAYNEPSSRFDPHLVDELTDLCVRYLTPRT